MNPSEEIYEAVINPFNSNKLEERLLKHSLLPNRYSLQSRNYPETDPKMTGATCVSSVEDIAAKYRANQHSRKIILEPQSVFLDICGLKIYKVNTIMYGLHRLKKGTRQEKISEKIVGEVNR